MDAFSADVKHSLRLFWRHRGFSALVIVTLAMGIASSTAVVSVADAVLRRPLPHDHPSQLVRLKVDVPQKSGKRMALDPSEADRIAWSRDSTTLEHVSAFRSRRVVVTSPLPERIQAMEVSAGYFEVYGGRPLRGRTIVARDTERGAESVAVISYSYWQSRLNGNPAVLGQTLALQGKPATIVGIMPRDFFPRTYIWLPLLSDPVFSAMRGAGVSVHARLKAGSTALAAAQELTSIIAPPTPIATPPQAVVQSLLEETAAAYRPAVRALGGTMLVLILICCVNVAGLLLARGVSRAPEFAVRTSLGAGRMRLITQLLTESLMLCAFGGCAGLFLTWLTLNAFVAALPLTLPPNAIARLDWSVLAFAALIVACSWAAFGIPTAWHLSRVEASPTLFRRQRLTGRALSRRVGQTLIAVEIALTVASLAGAAVMIRSFGRLVSVDLGFDPRSFTIVEATPLVASDSAAAKEALYLQLLESMKRLPGVVAAGATDQVPLAGNANHMSVRSADRGDLSVAVRRVVPGYFAAAGMSILSGRDLVDSDRSGSSILAALLNEEAAKRLFGADPAIGQRLTLGDQVLEIVGVLRDIRHRGPLVPVISEVYVPFRAEDPASTGLQLSVVVRPQAGTEVTEAQVRSTARAEVPQLLVERVRQGKEAYAETIARHRQQTVLVALLGVVALLIAVVGIVTVTSFATARRTQEIGVRMAFGATPQEVIRALVIDSVAPATVGILAGLALTFLFAPALKAFLFNTTPTEPAALLAAAILIGVAVAFSAWLPARLATATNPADLLRGE